MQPTTQDKKRKAKDRFFSSKAGQHLLRKRRGLAYDPSEWRRFEAWGD